MSVYSVRDLRTILADMPEDAEIEVQTGSDEPSRIRNMTLTTHHDTFAVPETRRTYVTIWLY